MDGPASGAVLSAHDGDLGFHEVGVLVRVGSGQSVVQDGAEFGLDAPAFGAPLPRDCPSVLTPAGGRGAAGTGLGRAVKRGAGTVAAPGPAASLAGWLGAAA